MRVSKWSIFYYFNTEFTLNRKVVTLLANLKDIHSYKRFSLIFRQGIIVKVIFLFGRFVMHHPRMLQNIVQGQSFFGVLL